ncbi:histidine kinase dimerization/phospho-acceptor domain-containing protein [Marinobacterium sp. xm-d-564]|uniref:histidine kinase dimerization/phospho-acceptor domain-containing protein n=1 Tax=Marinobacterium sp. xm-d-564 TaxID=2497742 RepID=UPI001569A473|nr:histidine kinase dimerization/phospho-acceptor domain-containing protein [Marinobacterium sp. xm-d-564]NRP58782.1 Signal transduction histidine-protein kinase BarA [Marinobacterium sp. xm-d-564]
MKERKIARKIVWWAVFAGILASLLVSGVQFLLEYQSRLAQVNENIRAVGETFKPSLTQSLWSYDLAQADLQMQAMVQQPFISSGQLIIGESEAPRVYGAANEEEFLEQRFELSNVDIRDQSVLVGTLVLRSDLDRVRDQLATEGLRALIANSLVILVIAGVLTLIFQVLVTRRISTMASIWGEVTEDDLRAGNLHERITRLSPRHAHKQDEIDQLERVIELLYGTGYRALQEAEQKEHILIELKKKAESANVAKSEFLANMSHEIRTPMNGVTGIADLLLRSKLSSNQEMLVRQLQSSAKNLLQIINDILDFSKIEADELDLNPVAFDPASLIAEVARSFTSTASAKNIGYTDLMVDGAPSPHQSDTTLRWLIDRLRS